MSISRQLRGQVIDLVALIHDGEATSEDRSRLQKLIVAEEAVRQFYIDYCHMAACLHWTMGRSSMHASAAEWGAEFAGMLDEVTQVEAASTTLTPSTKVSVRLLSWISLTAAIAAVLFWVVVGLLLMPRDVARRNAEVASRDRDLPALPAEADLTVAAVSGAWDCRWISVAGKPTSPVREGQRLESNRILEITQGQVQLTFDEGATVFLDGPMRFKVLSPKRGYLQVGRLGAVVPAVAKGFEIDTPAALITDLGTEFSVEVDPAGKAQVQVIRGEVELTPKAALAAKDRVATFRLTRGKAASVEPGKENVKLVTANPERAVSVAGKLTVSHRVGPHNSFLASATDLIDESSQTVLRTISSIAKPLDESDARALHNGTIYDVGTPNTYAGTSALCPPNGMSVTYDLNLEDSPTGYDILWIMSISGGGEGRRGQRYRVELSTVDNDQFFGLVDEQQLRFADDGEGEMHVRLERSNKQPLGRGIDQIRFTFFDAPGAAAASAYREIDVFGRPTTQ